MLGGTPSDTVLDFVEDLADRPALIVELLQAFVSERRAELANGRARLTGLGLHRAMSELRGVAIDMPQRLRPPSARFTVSR